MLTRIDGSWLDGSTELGILERSPWNLLKSSGCLYTQNFRNRSNSSTAGYELQ